MQDGQPGGRGSRITDVRESSPGWISYSTGVCVGVNLETLHGKGYMGNRTWGLWKEGP